MINTEIIKPAIKILDLLIKDKRSLELEVNVNTFDNCREQGYLLDNYDVNVNVKTIAFSRNRSSDDYVVYHSTEKYCNGTFGYTDEFWKNARYFDFDKEKEVVDYIFNLLKANNLEESK